MYKNYNKVYSKIQHNMCDNVKLEESFNNYFLGAVLTGLEAEHKHSNIFKFSLKSAVKLISIEKEKGVEWIFENLNLLRKAIKKED